MTAQQDIPAVAGDATSETEARTRTHPARIAGRLALGLALGLALLPAALELASLAGAENAFKYQGF